MDLIQFTAVTMAYPAPKGRFIRVLKDVTFRVGAGRFVAILGPSGCGKSTLLRILAGLISDFDGQVEYLDDEFSRNPLAISMNFQKPVLLPWLTVAQNAVVPFEASGRAWTKANQLQLDALMEVVGLQGFSDALPSELSGGMNMRAALVRSFITKPKLLLMDEPLAALDEVTRTRLGIELRALAKDAKTTVIFVTHSVQEAVFLADEIVLLSARPARVLDRIEIQLPERRDQSTFSLSDFGRLTNQIRDRIAHD